MSKKHLTMKPQKLFAAVNLSDDDPWVDPGSLSWSAKSARDKFVAGTAMNWDEWKKEGWRIRRVLVITDNGQ